MVRYLRKIVHYIWILLITVVLTSAASTYYSLAVAEDTYEATVSCYVYQDTEKGITENLQAGDMIAADLSSLLISDYILDRAKATLPNFMNSSNKDIADSIDTIILNNTRIMEITMTGKSPNDLVSFLKNLTTAVDGFTQTVYGQETILLLGDPKSTFSPVSPIPSRDIPIGAASGLVLGLLIIFLIDSLQEEIKISK